MKETKYQSFFYTINKRDKDNEDVIQKAIYKRYDDTTVKYPYKKNCNECIVEKISYHNSNSGDKKIDEGNSEFFIYKYVRVFTFPKNRSHHIVRYLYRRTKTRPQNRFCPIIEG